MATCTVDEAFEIVVRETPVLDSESVPLEASSGRVLAEDVVADVEMPPFDRAMMDGYAVRAADLRHVPVTLPVAGQVRAGAVPSAPLAPGTAVQIMTGAPLPAGADAVLPVERTRTGPGGVACLESVAPGAHVAPRGSEVAAGTAVLASGTRIGPAQIAVLATFGRARVRVGCRPVVAVLVTGDELVPAGERPGPGRIRNANGPAVIAAARRAGADVRDLGIAADDAGSLDAAVARGLEADVLVVSGGVSAGVYDLVEPALARVGVVTLFDRVAIKPGAPLVFGRRGRTLVFGLPGNPVSAQVTFDLFARAALLRMQGARAVRRAGVTVELVAPASHRSGRRAHLPARVVSQGGRLVARPLGSRGSADVVAHAAANALVVLEADRHTAAAGETAVALPLDGFLEVDPGEQP